ncbi:MAG: tetratricopeptide repeat protein [Planctomycetota bacterium]|nr:tetratricopeptide repeat protein [Planctomycetota bacterium]
MKRFLVFLFVVPVMVFSSADGFCSEWWNKEWRYRRSVKVEKRERQTDWVAVRFFALTEVKPDGSDIRVTDERGKEVSFYVVWAEPFSFVEVMFKAKGGVENYYVYYGNPNAQKSPIVETPNVGLIMETRERPRGTSNSWDEFKKLLEKSKKVYGRMLVPNIFSGHNPFGPSDYYITVYKGFLYAPEDGEYRIATNSDDSSFVFIDGSPVVSWPGVHGASAVWGERNGKIELKKGVHTIEYYHEDGEGAQVCVLGWWKPKDEQVSLIPEWAFPSPGKASAGPLEIEGIELRIDVNARLVSEFATDSGALLIAGDFKAHGEAKTGQITYKWDFGDGVTSQEQKVTHIFCVPDTYTVSIEISDGKEKFVGRIRHYVGYIFFYDEPQDKNNQYTNIIRSYPFDKLSTPALKNIASFADFLEDEPLRLRALEELIKRKDLTQLRETLSFLRDAGRLFITVRRDFESATMAFKKIEELTKEPWWVSQAKVGVADSYLYLKKDVDTALKMYEEVFEQFRQVSPGYAKVARIRIGDIMRLKGEYEKAKESYRMAKEMTASVSRTDEQTRRGAVILDSSNYIERGLYQRALKEIENWEWQIPTDKLDTEYSIIRARALYILKRYEESLLELEGFVNVNEAKDCSKKSSFYPEALYGLGVVYHKMGKSNDAKILLERLISEHPEAKETVKKAKELLGSIR